MKRNNFLLDQKQKSASASRAIAAPNLNHSTIAFVKSPGDIARGVDQLRWERAFSDPNDFEVVRSV
jgi:hypothetical protein